MKKTFILFLLFSLKLLSQCPPDTTGYQVIQDLTICFTQVSAVVQYNPDCSCYYYTYTISSSNQNKGDIYEIWYDGFKTSKEYFMLDLSLPYNPQCDYPMSLFFDRDRYIKRKEIPHSFISCPEKWDGSGHRAIGCVFDEYMLKPGQSITFTIASYFPPGKRIFEISPDDYEAVDQWLSQFPPDDGEEHFTGDAEPPLALRNVYGFKVEVPGPVDPEELELFNGGGQKPDDVNLFLRYANPKESQTELPAGQNTFEVLIYYGKTIKKETFKATLNDQDIKSLFYPVPGGGDYVKLNLKNGRNVLEFSVDGLNQRGQVANDKDRLVLIVK